MKKKIRLIRNTPEEDADVVEYFKAGGSGWQSRVNEALKEYIESR